MNYVIEGSGALFNEKGVVQPLKAGDFALVKPEGLTCFRHSFKYKLNL